MRLLLDTSVFIADETGRRLGALPAEADLAISAVTLAELRLGVLMAEDEERPRRLATLERAIESFEALPVDSAVAERFASLVAALRRAGRRMGVQDAWIAATALAAEAGIATQDAEFEVVPGLEVVRV